MYAGGVPDAVSEPRRRSLSSLLTMGICDIVELRLGCNWRAARANENDNSDQNWKSSSLIGVISSYDFGC